MLATVSLVAHATAITSNRYRIIEHPDPIKREELQDVITWDEKSLYIHGERIMIFSGEFHPFRYLKRLAAAAQAVNKLTVKS